MFPCSVIVLTVVTMNQSVLCSPITHSPKGIITNNILYQGFEDLRKFEMNELVA